VHVFGATTEELVAGCHQAKAAGFSAIGHLTPFLDEPPDIPYFETHVGKIRAAIDRVRQYREAVGDSVDLCIEVHRRLTTAEAIVLGRGIEPFHPMFYEDPVRPDNFDSMAAVARQVSVPIATGERLHTIDEFAMLLVSRQAVPLIK
jgi:galactonate dehydratase